MYNYNITDHLGNIRAEITPYIGGAPLLVQGRDYYTFGMEMSQLNNGTSDNKYQYNGKELQDDFGLYWYDYGARSYDAMLGRWHSMDHLAEQYYGYSPFHFCGNNPLLFVDETGMDWYKYTDEDGNDHYKYQDGSDKNIKDDDNTYSNVGSTVSINLYDDIYLNAFQNLTMASYGDAINLKDKILNSDKLLGDYLGKGSSLSEQGQLELIKGAIYQGQTDFLNDPRTKATVNALLFVATGGVEASISLASGAKSLTGLIKNSQTSGWLRKGKILVSNQIVKGAGTPGATVTWGIKGGGNLAKTGESMGFHYHIHKYNWYNPLSWFKQTPIIKPPKL